MRNPDTGMPPGTVSAALARLNLLLMAPLGLLCLALFAHHRSTDPVAFGWSWRYLLVGMTPLAALVAVPLAALGGWNLLVERVAPRRAAAWCVLAAVLILGAFWTLRVQGPVESCLAAFWMMSILIVGVSACAGRTEGLLIQLALALIGLLLLAPEAVRLREPRRERPFGVASWGDDRTFASFFPRRPPFLGPGGRLRPGVSLRIARSSVDRVHTVRFGTNRLGFRNDEEPDAGPDRDALTVLNLGDSFANGYGIDQDAFLGPLLRDVLARRLGREVKVWNAEVSDPCYGAHYVQEHGTMMKPRIVLFGLAGNDLLQGFVGCGPEGALRLGEDGRVDGKRTPPPRTDRGDWTEYAYPVPGDRTVAAGASPPVRRTGLAARLMELRILAGLEGRLFPERDETSRRAELTVSGGALLQRGERKLLFEGFPNLGFSYRQELPPARDSYAVTLPLIESMARNAEGMGARFVLVYFPQRHQVQPQDWEILRRRWRLAEEDFDLDLERGRLRAFCAAKGIEMVDLTLPFREGARTRNLYLPWDGHPNEAGHRIAAEVIGGALEALLSRDGAAAASQRRSDR